MRFLILALAAPLLWGQQGIITTFAGGGTAENADGGPATNAILGNAYGLALDSAGNLYIGETYKGLRKVDKQGIITTLVPGVGPYGVAVDGAGNVYFSEDQLNIIDKVDPAGVVTRVAGTITAGYAGDGGPATKAWLQTPYGVAVDKSGNVYFADSGNNRIRKVDTTGMITTVAGDGTRGFSGDGGPATKAQLFEPWDVKVDAAGNLFIADYQNGRIRKVDTHGIITTIAGNGGAVCCSGEGGLAINAPIPLVEAVAVDNAGNVYLGQSGRIAKVDSSGKFQTIAGLGLTDADNIPATSAYLADTRGIAVDAAGNVYISTGYKATVRKVTFPSTPRISSAINGASFQGPIVPNSWATILGTNLAAVTDTWDKSIVNGKLPDKLDGVTVTIDGKPAYLYYVSSGQINFVVPDIAFGSVQVTVTNSSGTSAAFTATSSQYGPAFFVWPGNQAVATRQDFSWAVKNGTFAGTATVAAKPGDTIILWGTGFGPTTPVAPEGSLTPSDRTYSTSSLPTVTIDNLDAKVYGAALTPGFAGLYQVAIQVPTPLADGDWPVIASIGGVQSPAGVVLSVHQ